MTGIRISVVIPARNEEHSISRVLAELPPEYEVIVVDGRSTDATAEMVRQARRDVILLEQEGHGKGDAVALGVARATGDIVVMADADGSMDPAEIPRFVEALIAGADLVKGSRFLDGGGSGDITRMRTIGNACLTRTVNVLFGTKYTDLCYGFMAFWRHRLLFSLDAPGFEIETLVNIRAARADLRVVEIPSYEHPRQHGSSNLRIWRDGLRILRTIVRERVRRQGGFAAAGDELVRDLHQVVTEVTQATKAGP